MLTEITKQSEESSMPWAGLKIEIWEASDRVKLRLLFHQDRCTPLKNIFTNTYSMLVL